MFSCESKFQDKSFSLSLPLSSPSFFCFHPSISFIPYISSSNKMLYICSLLKGFFWCFPSSFSASLRKELLSVFWSMNSSYYHFLSGFWGSLDSVSFFSSVSKIYLKICWHECEFVSVSFNPVLYLVNYFM